MKIKYLYIKNYKKFENFSINFGFSKNNELQNSIFKKMNITSLIGENGSGKTTILSFISIVFRYLQRKQNAIPSDFVMEYEINNIDVELSKEGENIFIAFNGEPKQLLLEYDLKKGYFYKESQREIKESSVIYDDITQYLPRIVVVSSFDIDYPNGYAWNYVGHRLVKVSSGYAFQKESSLGLDISLGIFKFMTNFYGTNKYFIELVQSLGLNLSDKVCAYQTDVRIENHEEIQEKIVDILDKYEVQNSNQIAKLIIEGEYFYTYFSKGDEYLVSPFELFDLHKYLDDKEYHEQILEVLIEENLFYINDFYLNKNGFEYSMSQMSTGEKVFLGRIFFILANLQDNAIVILEEPEVHLNYSWVKQIISIFIVLFNNYNSHFFISSHNYAFINNLMEDQILIMNDESVTIPPFKTLLCTNEELNHRVFYKHDVQNYIEHYIQELLIDNRNNELKKIFENLGESYTKLKLFKRLIESGDIRVED